MVNTLTVKGCDLQVFLYFCARVIAVKMSIGGGQAFLSPMISALLEGQNRREFPHHSVHFFFSWRFSLLVHLRIRIAALNRRVFRFDL